MHVIFVGYGLVNPLGREHGFICVEAKTGSGIADPHGVLAVKRQYFLSEASAVPVPVKLNA